MKAIYYTAFGIHILCVIAILGLLLSQVKKSEKKLNPGVVHATLTALVAALVMVGLYSKVHPDEVLNHTKLGVKGLVIAVILTLGYTNVKKAVLKNSIWATMLGLTLLNVIIASAWN
jgi:chromate transport protein ChrA